LPAKRPKKKRRSSPVKDLRPTRRAEESRGAEALTVLWMLATVATLAAEFVAGAGLLFFPANSSADEAPSPLSALPGVMLFTALTTGTLCLVLTPLVRRLRRTPPPPAVVWMAAVVGVSPWAILLIA
jgi:hypothetical protein